MAVQISIVSYYNTTPFVYGLDNYNETNPDTPFSVYRHYPSQCAQSLKAREVDIALIPVAALIDDDNYSIISDFGICANGPVDSVLLLSNDPVESLNTVVLDYQSRTSNNLFKILAKYFWKINPALVHGTVGFESQVVSRTGMIVIGDRAFTVKNNYSYCYDLAQVWKQMTGLPFVFACWVANKKIDSEYLSLFEGALNFGVENIQLAIDATDFDDSFDLKDYLTNKIKYRIGKKERQALDLFLAYCKQL